MGKYSLDLLGELARKTDLGYKNVVLIFSKRLDDNNDAVAVVSRALPNAQIEWLDLRSSKTKAIGKDSEHNQKILENFIEQKKYKADFLMLSVFQKPTCPAFPANAGKNLLFYDLIPLLYHRKYKPDDNYLSRLRLLFEAEKIFTISQTVQNDLNTLLGVPIKKIMNIDGAPIKRKHLRLKKPIANVPKRYILMPTGDDVRKNNVVGVKGFELYRKADPNIKLVLTSKFEPGFKAELKRHSRNLVFVGNVTEVELGWLYANADMLLFPSEYEGLGLPVLEAVVDNKKVVCSDIPVFREMSKTAFYYFDHHDPTSVANALKAAADGSDWEQKQSEYEGILKIYSWGHTARRLVKGLKRHTNKNLPENAKKLKLAILAPFPSGYSAIGKVVAELHPTFSQKFDIDYYFEAGLSGKVLRPNYLHFVSTVYYAKDFGPERYSNYDAVIYHIGNSEYHFEAIKNALYLPGFVIIHDTFLDGVFNELQKSGYISAKRNETERIIDSSFGSNKSSCLASIANAQLGLVVHSSYAKNALQEILAEDLPIKKANLPVSTPLYNIQDQSHSLVHIGLAGILTERKGLDIVEQIASLDQFKNCVIDIFGFNYGQKDFLKKVSKYPNVIVNTNLSDFEYQTKLAQLDILINYRHDYRGETSLTALEAMRYGAVVIVKNVGWFSELPDEAVVKVESSQDLINRLTGLVQNKQERATIGREAQKCTTKDYSPEQYAHNIEELIVRGRLDSINYKIREALLSAANFKNILEIINEPDKENS
jgi:glycosyltransferase involved in cell wall biosynthesis